MHCVPFPPPPIPSLVQPLLHCFPAGLAEGAGGIGSGRQDAQAHAGEEAGTESHFQGPLWIWERPFPHTPGPVPPQFPTPPAAISPWPGPCDVWSSQLNPPSLLRPPVGHPPPRSSPTPPRRLSAPAHSSSLPEALQVTPKSARVWLQGLSELPSSHSPGQRS